MDSSSHRSSVSSKARFFLLQTTESINLLQTLLGCVVSDKTQPTKHRRPYFNDNKISQEEKKELQKLMGSLLNKDNAVEINDIKIVHDRSTDAQTKARFTDLFRAAAQISSDHEVNIEAGTAVRYKFDNPGAELDNLMDNTTYRSQLQKMVAHTESLKLPMITGILVAKDIEVSVKNDTGKELDLSGSVNLLEQLGLIDLTKKSDLKLEFIAKKSTNDKVFARIKSQVIFAIAYDYINIQASRTPAPKNIFSILWEKLMFWKNTEHGSYIIEGAKLGKDARGPGIDVLFGGSSVVPDQPDLEQGSDSELNFSLEYREADYESEDQEEPSSKA